MVPFGHYKVRQLLFAGSRCRSNDDVAEQRAKGDVTIVLIGEFFDDLRPALGVCPIVFGDDLNWATIDTAGLVDQVNCSICRTPIPTAIGGTNSGRMLLETNLDRCRRLRAGKASQQW